MQKIHSGTMIHRQLKSFYLRTLSCGKYYSTTLNGNGQEFQAKYVGYAGGFDLKEKRATEGFQHFDKHVLSQKLFKSLSNKSTCLKENNVDLEVYDTDGTKTVVATTMFGKVESKGATEEDEVPSNEDPSSLKEMKIRNVIGSSVQRLQDLNCSEVIVDPCGYPQAAAETAVLSLFNFDELKAKDKQKGKPTLTVYTDHLDKPDSILMQWNRGIKFAEGQNLARRLMEMPANLLPPTRFAQIADDTLKGVASVSVIQHNKQWIEENQMGAFLGVAQGSNEMPVFLEVRYEGNPSQKDKHVALVGKGVTFDSGGISIKPSAGMELMRGDMGGAAVVTGVMHALAQLRVPMNVRAYMPLCENMPGPGAQRPGDVVRARNGTTVQVDNTDAEGRLILADALCYASDQNPTLIIDVATLTGAIAIALGNKNAGLFFNNESSKLRLDVAMTRAGIKAMDRMWPMPIHGYLEGIKKSHLADLNNISTEARDAGASTAAAFLSYFVPKHIPWMHLDIAGVMETKSPLPYLRKGMSGRPVRTILEFLSEYAETGGQFK